MIDGRALAALSFLLVTAAALAGYLLGPEEAAITVGVALASGIFLVLMQRVQSGGMEGPAWNVPRAQRQQQPAGKRTEAPEGEGPAAPLGMFARVEDDDPTYDPKSLFWQAAGIRLLAAIVFNQTRIPFELAPDSWGYTFIGELVYKSWSDPTIDPVAILGERIGLYYTLNAYACAIFGSDIGTTVMSMVNALVGALACWNFASLTERLYGKRAAKRAFQYGAFFPSLILWTSVNIREAWSFLTISFALLAAQNMREKLTPKGALILLASLVSMSFIREYLVPLLALSIGLSFVVVRLRQLPYAVVGLVILTMFARSVGEEYGIDVGVFSEEKLAEITSLRSGLAYGGSAYGKYADTSTVSGMLLYMPEGLARFLLAPFPWSVRSWRQAIAIPETFFWIYLFITACRRLAADCVLRLPRVALLVFVSTIVTVAYAMVEGNEGTAYRHRAQVMHIFFIFAAGEWARRTSPVDSALRRFTAGRDYAPQRAATGAADV